MKSRNAPVVVLVGLILGAVLLGSAACGDAPREPTAAAPSPTASATASPSPEPTPTAHPGPDRDPDAGPTPTLAPEPTATATATARPHVTLSGTGPATRDIIIPTEGTWTMTIDVSKNSRCDDAKRCRRAELKIGLDTRGGGSSLVVAETASDWTGQIRLRIANRSGSYAPGVRIVTVNVAPMAEWMLTFVPPGAPVPTQRPAATPTPLTVPTPTPRIVLTIAEIRAGLPCLTAAEASYLHDFLVELAKGQEQFAALLELGDNAREDPNVVRTAAFQRDLASAAASWRSSLRNAQVLSPPTSTRGQELHAAVVALVASSLDLVALVETTVAVGDFDGIAGAAPVLVPYNADLAKFRRLLFEACQ